MAPVVALAAEDGRRTTVEWRARHGWSEAELASRLRRVDASRSNFGDAPGQMTAERGWNEVRSHAVVAHEAPGSPEADGAFARACRLVAAFEHSDPRIVVAHFDPVAPLAGRPALLELQALGFRFLCPVAVRGVRDDRAAERATWGFALETLPGHLERGREWFLVEKDVRSGEVRFRIEAAWRAGDFPGPWAWLGFQVMGRHYQRAWHRLAHARLRRLLAAGTAGSARGLLQHGGRAVDAEAIHLAAVGARGVRIEREDERMRWDRWLMVVGFGALAGARSMSAPALLAIAGARRPIAGGDRVARAFSSKATAAALAVAAFGELAADKWAGIPPRTAPPSLAFRTASGALAGDLLAARSRGPAWRAALIGAAAAAAATFATRGLRALVARRVPEPRAGFVEDVLVLGAGTALLARMGALRPRGQLELGIA